MIKQRRNEMRNIKSIPLVLSAALMLSLFSACGGGDDTAATANSSKSGSQKGEAAAEVSEAAVNAEDFYGIWEYQDSYNWICIYGDGTYDWYNSDGLSESGGYTIDGAELHLDNESGLFFCLDGEGGMIDSDGDALFMSELPGDTVTVGSDPGDGGVGADFSDAGDFFGTWESASDNRWLVIYSDGTWTQYYEDGSYDTGSYYMDEGELCLDVLDDRFYTLANGNIESVYGGEMFSSEVPQHILEGYSGNTAYYGSDPGDYGYVYGSDPGDYGDVSAVDYYGTWERSDSAVWYTINSDGSYKMTYFDGDFSHGSYWMDGYQLVLDDGCTLDLYQGNVVDNEGYMYYLSVEPEF